jgi:hypothetical protein
MIIASDEGFTNDDIFDVDKSSLAIGGSSIRVREGMSGFCRIAWGDVLIGSVVFCRNCV